MKVAKRNHTQHHAINHTQAGLVHQTTGLREVLAAMQQVIKNHIHQPVKLRTQAGQPVTVKVAKEKQVKEQDLANANSRQKLQRALLSKNVKARQVSLSVNQQNHHTIK